MILCVSTMRPVCQSVNTWNYNDGLSFKGLCFFCFISCSLFSETEPKTLDNFIFETLDKIKP